MTIIIIAVIVGTFAAGLWAGYWIALRQARREFSDVLERVEPGPRTPGQPTNIDAPPSRVTEPKRRPGHFMS
jgi:hypothetical protein